MQEPRWERTQTCRCGSDVSVRGLLSGLGLCQDFHYWQHVLEAQVLQQ